MCFSLYTYRLHNRKNTSLYLICVCKLLQCVRLIISVALRAFSQVISGIAKKFPADVYKTLLLLTCQARSKEQTMILICMICLEFLGLHFRFLVCDTLLCTLHCCIAVRNRHLSIIRVHHF